MKKPALRASVGLFLGLVSLIGCTAAGSGSPQASASATTTATVAPSATTTATVAPSATTSPATSASNAAEAMVWHEGDPTPDGCTVATAEEVSLASGFEIVETLAHQGGQPGCAYFDADGLILSTRFHQRDTGEGNFAAELARPDVQELDGIGDRAIWIVRGWNLWAWQGDTLVMMGIGKIGETPERFELAKKLAPLIVDRFADDG